MPSLTRRQISRLQEISAEDHATTGRAWGEGFSAGLREVWLAVERDGTAESIRNLKDPSDGDDRYHKGFAAAWTLAVEAL